MIQGVNNLHSIRGVGAADPFQAFEVEFGTGLQAPQALPDQAVTGPSFGEVLMGALNDVSTQQRQAEQLAFDFATGKPVDIHSMMIEAAKSDVLVQLTSSVVSKTATGINQLLQTQI